MISTSNRQNHSAYIQSEIIILKHIFRKFKTESRQLYIQIN